MPQGITIGTSWLCPCTWLNCGWCWFHWHRILSFLDIILLLFCRPPRIERRSVSAIGSSFTAFYRSQPKDPGFSKNSTIQPFHILLQAGLKQILLDLEDSVLIQKLLDCRRLFFQLVEIVRCSECWIGRSATKWCRGLGLYIVLSKRPFWIEWNQAACCKAILDILKLKVLHTSLVIGLKYLSQICRYGWSQAVPYSQLSVHMAALNVMVGMQFGTGARGLRDLKGLVKQQAPITRSVVFAVAVICGQSSAGKVIWWFLIWIMPTSFEEPFA